MSYKNRIKSSQVVFRNRQIAQIIEDLRARELERGAVGADGDDSTITVGTVTTLPPGSPVSVVNVGTPSAAVLNFGIPEGDVGAAGGVGPTGPAGLANIGTPVVPVRALNSDFTPDATKPCLVGYSYQLHTVLTLVGTSFAQVQLLADPGPGTPTTVRSTARHQINIGVGISVNQQSDVISSVYALIPSAWVCRLVSATGNGGTVTSVAQVEVPLQP